MTTGTTSATRADALLASDAVATAIESIVEQVEAARAPITGVCAPRDELRQSYEQTLDRLSRVKGRPPVFPYVGSGLGRGALVELADGSIKWDLISGIGVHAFGHGDADLLRTALRASLSDTVMQGNLQCNADAIAFAELLLDEAGRTSGLAHCFLTNSGAVANESALKVCNQARGGTAPRVLAFNDCFLGRTASMSQIGDNAAGRVGQPLHVLVDYIPFYDASRGEASIAYALERLHEVVERYPGQHACFTMELVQGEGGFNTAPREFFVELCTVCREQEVPIWFDEVQSFGRTEQMFHFEHLELGEYADIVTIGKMSQVCACLYTEAMNPRPGLLSGTFIGSTMGLQVGRRMLERLRDGDYYGSDGRIARLYAAFATHAKALVERHPEWFPPIPHARTGAATDAALYGGTGGMMRLTPFGGVKAPIVSLLKVLFEHGIIAFYCGHGPYHLRFLPPVGVMAPEHFDEIFPIVESALAAIAAEVA